ncbi:hypothetical protein CLAFUW4_12374 [Fulvia fulva]|uniref:Uncharacterized protein n=1 Tax=Passalora fulva TaxID=5499 RepID=A0A9Q8PED1_PASFU|nr:uncharacterized protein CLAFUR5_11403 [Fulvia fulva]KAK4617695.1 hypothetical protein CLAFUR4_12379 [Fulvia fulva]KAK4619114.1 hypothetical protein CLAFUR0_12390 [Fulvia fulva]UJO21029.1 hypothetical protein CLAFUR5_11403 [Fulvia fulva]WPV17847.1 hypothetical protein CLAFUW4_12374 [Fulvia fulva]WPV33556.1 hypothetical protein CLAFUW7_12381 [Fulvia fulva]
MSSILNSLFSTVSSLQPFLTFPRPGSDEPDQSQVQQGGRHVVLVGPSEPFCQRIAEHLLPDHQVVQVLSSISAASEVLHRIQDDRSSPSPDDKLNATPRHVVLGKGFREQQMEKMREDLGGDDPRFSWYWTPTESGERPPLPRTLAEDELNVFAQKIAAHIAEVIDDVVAKGEEGSGQIYAL